MEFAADARLFIAELDGLLKVFDGIDDSTPDIARDLRDQVHSVDGRGLFGIALDAGFPSGHHRQQLRNVASPVRIEHVPPPTAGWHRSMTVIQVAAGTSPTQDEIIARCADRLARFKLLPTVKSVKMVQRNQLGQVLKIEPRKPYWEGRKRSVN
jgi:hypothetical protein